MEHLTKQQIVLLTLLVSFVTSIATGIFTVTLMQQAPQGVTQTINKIVERTVEKVVPVETQKAQVVRQEVTTVVKQEDLIADSVAHNEKSLVRIYGSLGADPAELFLGYGVVVHTNGVVVTDRKVYAENVSYEGVYVGGKRFPLELLRSAEGESVLFFKPTLSANSTETFVPATFANSDAVRLGQAAVSLTGETRTSVSIGVVTGLEQSGGDERASTSTPRTARPVTTVETNLPTRLDSLGSPLLNVASEVVGIYLGSDSLAGRTYLPVNLIKTGIASTSPGAPAPHQSQRP